MKVNVAHNGNICVKDVMVADNFWLKLTGYMFRNSPHVPGILFETNSIQTTFMKFKLDLVFLNRQNKVVKIIREIKPWRFTRFYFKVHKTLELPIGLLPKDLQEGDVLEVIHV